MVTKRISKKERELKTKLKKSAVEIESTSVRYVCPNNRKNKYNSNGVNHWYCVHTDQILTEKKSGETELSDFEPESD